MKSKRDNKIKSYFLILYQGLNEKVFYWEYVNTLRKILILSCLFFDPTAKLFFSCFVLMSTERLEHFLKPYKRLENTKVELLAVTAGGVTMNSGLVYSQDEHIVFLNYIVLSFVVYFNLWFVIEWIYLFTENFKEKYKIIMIVRRKLVIVDFS